jgi:archaellum biogenesis protein FlaJ (TadC family)
MFNYIDIILIAIIGLVLNVIILCYLVYTFLPETRLWKDFKLNKLPLTEIKNDWFFYVVCVMSVALLLVSLIDVANFSGVMITIFDTFYTILFGRYIFLYKEYVDGGEKKKVKSNG